MKCIELGAVDYKIIIPLIYPILYQIKDLLHKNEDRPIFTCFTNFCGFLFAGIIYSIIKCRMKKNKSITQENFKLIYEIKSSATGEYSSKEQVKKINTYSIGENQVVIEKHKIESKRKRNQYLFILLLVFIYLIPMSLDTFVSANRESYFGTSSAFSLFFYIFFYISFSRIILGQKIYSHQIFSTIIITISNIIVIIIIFVEKSNLSKYNFLNYVLVIIITGLFALNNYLEQKYFNIYMDSPYHVMFMLGLFSLILILLYETITVLIFGYDTEFNGIFYQFYKNFEHHGFLYILIFIGEVLTAFILLAGIQLTIYFFTPCHFNISESISKIITAIIHNTFKEFSVIEKIIISILFIIILFSAFIYNEVIIINVCKLNKNTKKYILMRQTTETEEILLRLKTIDNESTESE